MNDPKGRREYSTEEVGAIVRLALERQGPEGRISHDELLETAREIGVSAADIEEAVAEEARIRQARAEIGARRRRLKEQFIANLVSFVVVNAALFIVDRMTTGGTWFYWPLLVWGVAVGVHAAVLLFPRSQDDAATLEATRGRARARIDAAFDAARSSPRRPMIGRGPFQNDVMREDLDFGPHERFGEAAIGANEERDSDARAIKQQEED